jgi:hypothetical protein
MTQALYAHMNNKKTKQQQKKAQGHKCHIQ